MAATPAAFTGVAPISQAPQSADIALIAFFQDFKTAWLNAAPPWASDSKLGYSRPTDALAQRYTIPLETSGFVSFEGVVKYRSLGLRHVGLRQQEWMDGVKEKASIVEAGDFTGFMDSPAIMAANGVWSPNLWIAADLDNGENIACWDSADWQPDVVNPDGSMGTGGTKFFDANHPANPFGAPMSGAPATWSNFNTGSGAALSLASFKAAKIQLAQMRKPNGQNMGLRATHIMVHPNELEIARDILTKDLIIDNSGLSAAQVAAGSVTMTSNTQKGVVEIQECPEFITPGTWYLAANNKPMVRGWTLSMARGGTPEILIRDKSSDFYKTCLEISFGAILRGSRRLTWPHAMIKNKPS